MSVLRVLMLNSEIAALRSQLTPLEQTRDGFAAREEQLRQAISEAATDEERGVVSTAIETFEQERSTNLPYSWRDRAARGTNPQSGGRADAASGKQSGAQL